MGPLEIVLAAGVVIVCLVFLWMIISFVASLFGSNLGGYAASGDSDGTGGANFMSMIAGGGKRRNHPNMGILLLALALGILGGYVVGTPSAN